VSRRDDAGSEDGGLRDTGWLADAMDAEAGQHMPDTQRIRARMRERTNGAQRKRRQLLSSRLAGVPAGIVAGALCVALVFAVTATIQQSAGSSPSSTVAPPPKSAQTIVTATGKVDAGSRAGWSQEDVAVKFAQPIAGFQLSVKVSLNSTGSSTGYSTTYDASLFDVKVDTQAHALVYKFDLKPGKTLPAGSSEFAVQFNYGDPHNAADDTYYVSVYTDKAHGKVPGVSKGAF